MKLQLSIRMKLLLSILLILVVSYSILLYSTVKSVNTSLEKKMIEDLEANLKLAQSEYLGHANQIQFSLMPAASSPSIQKALSGNREQELEADLQRWKKILPFIDILLITDAEKRIVARLGSQHKKTCLRLYDVFNTAARLKQPVISTELVANSVLCQTERDLCPPKKDGASMMMVVAIPVISSRGEFLGCIIAGDIINRDPHLPYQVKQIFGKELEVTITQKAVRIASSLKDESAGFATLPPSVLKVLEEGQPYRGDVKIAGQRYMTAFLPIENIKKEFIGSLSVALPHKDFAKIRRDNLRNIIVSAAIGICLCFIIAYIASQRLTGPIKEFSRAAGEIEAGRFKQRLTITSTDDFRIMANAFNKMADSLEEREATIRKKNLDLEDVNHKLIELNELLERRVHERTVELKMEMGRLEAILTNLAEGVIVTDGENQVVLFNSAAQRIFEILPYRVIGKKFDSICAMGEFCALTAFIRDIRENGLARTIRDEEISVRGKKLKVSLSPLSDDDGQFGGVVMSIRDITLEGEVDRMKTEFISTVSHELKTPLTSMKGSIDFILGKAETLTDTERELLSICQRNTSRLMRLITDILDITRIESGKLDFNFKPHRISELVNYSIEELVSFAASHSISIENRLADDLPMIFVDGDRIIQVITNLLSNAIKFSPDGEVVTVTGVRRENFLVVSVADCGKPIEWSDRDKLFKRFQQLDSSDRREHGGSGLGLAICKDIVEMHHGRIYYAEGEGGNVFTFTVPIYEEQS